MVDGADRESPEAEILRKPGRAIPGGEVPQLSVGRKPMCASVCPSQALFFGTREEISALRPSSSPINQFQFGDQTINTKVNMLVPKDDVSSLKVTDQLGSEPEDDMMMAGLYEEEALCN